MLSMILALAAQQAAPASAPPASAPPAPAPASTPQPSAINGPDAWFGTYPPAAIRAGEQGRVLFQLNVDAAGVVTNCTIIESSGSAVLDAATCDGMKANARFTPARDAKGKPVASVWRRATRWALPEQVLVPIASFSSVAKLNIDAAGTLNSCKAAAQGTVPVDSLGEPCAAYSTGTSAKYKLLKGDLRDAPALVVSQTLLTIDGDMSYPEQHRLGGRKLTSLARVQFDILPDGSVANCRVVETAGPTPPPKLCPNPIGPFEVASGRDTGRARSAMMLVAFSYQPTP